MLTWAALASGAHAQVAPAASAPAASAATAAPAAASAPEPASAAASAPPAATPPSAARPASAPTQELAPVVITGARETDVQQRRNSTAAKIVVGREEIERFGDSTIGETLKRLPGVTVSGTPGRGGAPRMRGMGSGYTLILLDGQRVPPGFSIDTLEPDQVERIEVLRAPTAETGARAIAGVINIVTREGFRKRLNNLRVGTGFENGEFQPDFSWTRNDTIDDLIYNFSLSARQNNRKDETVSTEQSTNLTNGEVTSSQREVSHSQSRRNSINATGRLQWRGEEGRSLMLQPMIMYSAGDSQTDRRLEEFVSSASAPYDISHTDSESSFSMARLNAEWKQPLGEGGRLELRSNFGQNRYNADSLRTDSSAAGGTLHTRQDHADARDTSLTLGGKYSAMLEGEQTLVTGVEVESNERDDNSRTLYDGALLPGDAGDNLTARITRVAAYVQDEWTLTPNWSAHAGLRWEGIRTRSNGLDVGTGLQEDVRNDSSVWTPLLHAVWKPDPKGNDQIRMSLTRTYRQPTLQSLVARPSVNSRNPAPGPNDPTSADRLGNPDLRPELATGLDVAFERYLSGGGMLSANVFYRQISDYMRTVTSQTPIDVFYSPGQPRYVTRTENVGDANTQGIELEARFRLSDAIDGAPRIDVRTNVSFFHSRVTSIPGPDNRIDSQPDGTANLGLDYKFASLPLSIGGNLNWTPGYSTRVTETQWSKVDSKLVGDAFALWTVNSWAQLRLSASNFAPRDYTTSSFFDDASRRDVSASTDASYVNWALRLELRL